MLATPLALTAVTIQMIFNSHLSASQFESPIRLMFRINMMTYTMLKLYGVFIRMNKALGQSFKKDCVGTRCCLRSVWVCMGLYLKQLNLFVSVQGHSKAKNSALDSDNVATFFNMSLFM